MLPLFLTSGPNELIVVTGLCHEKPAMVQGGRIVVFPGFHTWSRLSLNVMTLEVSSPGVWTAQGVPIQVTGVAQVKVASQHPDMLSLACEHFLSKNTREIENMVKETLEGHQRGIMGTMTVEDIYKNRKLFNERVFEVASRDLCNLGMTVLSYTIRDLSDDEGYLKALGMARTSEVMRDARIGEANAKRDATIQKSIANETLFEQKYKNQTEMAEAERNYTIKKANFDAEVQTQKATADLAYQLQESKTRQKIKEENMNTVIIEKRSKIEVAQQEAIRMEKMLEATIKQPATAEKYRMEKIAEAERQRSILHAEAAAEKLRLTAEAEANAILAKAEAEQKVMNMKAAAMKEYGQAALLDLYLGVLPNILGNVSSALSNKATIKMITSKDSPVGAAKLTDEVLSIASSVPNFLKNTTGIDIAKEFQAVC